MRWIWPALLLTLPLGCGVSLDARTDTDGVDALSLIALNPAYGPTAGGSTVLITGLGFTETTQVFFGSVALTPEWLDGETLRVITPNAGGPLVVDVRVRDGAEEDSLPAGFTFTDGGDPGPNPGGDGRVGGLVELTRLQVACPDCLGTSEFVVSAGAAFHPPAAGSWDQALPSLGQCVVNPTGGFNSGAGFDVGGSVSLRLGATQIGLARTSGASGVQYEAANLPVNQYVSNGSYDLVVPGAGSTAGFTVTGALRAADGFAAISPVEMLYTQPASAFQAVLSSSSGATFTWSPAGSGTSFVLTIEAYDAWTGAPLNRMLVCHGQDNGLMTVSGASIAQLNGGYEALATVGLYRRIRVASTLPGSGATLEGVAMSGVLGTATLY